MFRTWDLQRLEIILCTEDKNKNNQETVEKKYKSSYNTEKQTTGKSKN